MWVLEKRPDWVTSLVTDRRSARIFLGEHHDEIVRLLQLLNQIYNAGHAERLGLPLVAIDLSGRLGWHSRRCIDSIMAEARRRDEIRHKPHFVGTYVRESDNPEGLSLQRASERWGIKQGDWRTRWTPIPKANSEINYSALNPMVWSSDSKTCFYRNAVLNESGTLEDLRKLLEYATERRHTSTGGYLAFDPAPNVRRRLIHSLCRDLGLDSTSIGEGVERYRHKFADRITDSHDKKYTGAPVHPDAGQEHCTIQLMYVNLTPAVTQSPALLRINRPSINITMNHEKDVVYLRDATDVGRCFTPLLPIVARSKGHDASIFTHNHWIFRVQKLALALHSPSALELKRNPSNNFLARMPNLKILYLVIDRGCQCWATESWVRADSFELEYGFVSLGDAVRRHDLRTCRVGRMLVAADAELASLKAQMGAWAEGLEIKIVYDAYRDPVGSPLKGW
ncbi:hypothetical protein DL771_007196 [Monosporascus sp. 5C6A]|nr:hypothetical protein DL771_007196 [Monosporascus sp. 5C6A]